MPRSPLLQSPTTPRGRALWMFALCPILVVLSLLSAAIFIVIWPFLPVYVYYTSQQALEPATVPPEEGT